LNFLGGSGDDVLDVITVGDATHPLGKTGFLTLDAGQGLDTVRLDDSAHSKNRNYVIASDGQVSYDGAPRLQFLAAEILNLTAGGGDDRLDVTGVPEGTDALVNSGAGVDRISVSLDGLAALARVDGGADGGALAILDASPFGQQYTFGGILGNEVDFAIFRGIEPKVTYKNVSTVTLAGTAQGDVVNISGTPGGMSISVDGRGGADTLTGSNSVNVFFVTGADAGVHSGTGSQVAFASFEILQGKAGSDYFVFQGGSVSGRVEGDEGVDTLSYAGQTEAVFVSLADGMATGVGGGQAGRLSGIENVIGGPANDVLIGDTAANALYGGGGVDDLQGGAGNDLLIGGVGADAIRGSDGDDLLIAGDIVLSDYYGLALQSLYERWSRADLGYDARVAEMEADLIAAVLGDDDEDELLGQGDRDWFFSNFRDDELDLEILEILISEVELVPIIQ
ncbi:MAG: calcium-binding protein, partial [Pirellulaceae bacterium]